MMMTTKAQTIEVKEGALQPSQQASAATQLPEEEGLRGSHKGEKNMDALGDPAKVVPEDIRVIVDIALEREKDRELPDRVKLAKEAQVAVESELKRVFRGGVGEEAPALYVRALLLSDGSSLGHRWMAEHGVGEAKLALAHCLQSSSGGAASASLLCTKQDCGPAAKDGLSFREHTAAVVRTMARHLAKDIAQEVTREINDWKAWKSEGAQQLDLVAEPRSYK